MTNPIETLKNWVVKQFAIKSHRTKAELCRDLAPIISAAIAGAVEAVLLKHAEAEDAAADALEKES